MAMKGYSVFPKVPALLEPHRQIVKCHIRTLDLRVLPLCRDIVGEKQKNSRISKGYSWDVKNKQPNSGFELGLFIPFLRTITVTPKDKIAAKFKLMFSMRRKPVITNDCFTNCHLFCFICLFVFFFCCCCLVWIGFMAYQPLSVI